MNNSESTSRFSLSRRDALAAGAGLAITATASSLLGGGPTPSDTARPGAKSTLAEISMTNMTTSTAADPASFNPAPVVPLAVQAPARLIVDSPLPEQLARGYVVIRYRAENLRIMPVYGPSALQVTPRLGHLHITLDDLPWHWLDASGEPISINGLPAGEHKLLIELEDPTHKVIDTATVNFEIPKR